MTRRILVAAAILCIFAAPAFAVPGLSITPGLMESGNFVWTVGVAPDLILAAGSTPLAVELGFRLTGAPLLSATNINPAQWDFPLSGPAIFGWETPSGLQVNTTTDEIFVAYGSIDFATPGNKPFLRIVTQGFANGGAAASTIEWLGVYNFGNGRISQIVGGFTAADFDIYSGTTTQAIPEPTTVALLALGTIVLMCGGRRAGECGSL